MQAGFANQYRSKRLAAYERVQEWIHGHEAVAKFATALVLALLTGLLAQITIHTPLTPVPFTMQVLGIAFMGGLLGRNWGAVSALLYCALGVIGLPIFAGEMATFESWDFFRFALFTQGLSSWYLLGFVAQAYIIGAVVQSDRERRSDRLLAFAPIAIAALLLLALLDVYFLTDYGALYRNEAFPNAWFALLCLGILAIVASFTWLAFTRKARRERVELFFANVVGLLALYAIGAAGFYLVWHLSGLGALSLGQLLAFAVLPFIPIDLAKILLAIGVLTLVRPTQRELVQSRPETPA